MLIAPNRPDIVCRIEATFARIDRLVDESIRAARPLDRLDERLLAKAFPACSTVSATGAPASWVRQTRRISRIADVARALLRPVEPTAP